jgi:O-antigen/teichoic acid export membrane protein
MTDTTAQFKRQLPRNAVLQVLSFLTRVAIGILLTPYLVSHLGRAAYGLIPLAGVMTEYVSIITQTISSAVGRFLAIALQREDVQDANSVLNTAFFSYLVLTFVQIPVFGLFIYFADSIFTIPDALYWDAITLLICSAISFLISLICGVFGVPMYAYNRLDISRTLDVASQIARIAGIVVLFMLYGPALRYVGYVDLTLSILGTIVTVLIGCRLAPILKLNWRAYDWSKLREIMAMGGWLLLNYMGFLLFLKIDIWVCNRFIGPEAAGDYAAILQWSNLIRQAGALLAGVIGPMILIYYARGEIERLVRLSQLSVRILCLVLAIPISILCVFSSPILHLWLGESFAPLAPLMMIMLCHLTINVGILPLFGIQTALNKVKLPALVTCAMGMLNLGLAIFLAKFLGWGVYGVAVAGAIVLTTQNSLFTPIYAAIILKRPWHTFIRSSMSGVAFLAALLAFGCGLNYCVHPQWWGRLAMVAMTLGIVGVIAVWLMLSRADRRTMIDLMPRRFRPLAPRLMPVQLSPLKEPNN